MVMCEAIYMVMCEAIYMVMCEAVYMVMCEAIYPDKQRLCSESIANAQFQLIFCSERP
jgi:hypothetical protein